MKVCIVGLGAIGGLFAAWLGSRLDAGEIELSALARGATLAAVRQHGLRLHGAGRDTQQGADEPLSVLLHAHDDADRLGVQDLVILAVKGPSLPAVAPAVRRLCGPHTQVLAAMNGVPWWFFDGLPGPCAGLALESVDPGGKVAALIPSRQVVGCVVHASASVPAPGEVQPSGGNGLIVGRPMGGSDGADTGDSALQGLSVLLARAGFAVTLSPRIQRDVWFKLWGNMTMNPVSALTGAPCDRILDDTLVRAFCSAVMLEAQAIGAALGIAIDQQPAQRHAMTRKLGSFKTSMLQDAEAGRPLELDALLGAVREIGGHLRLPTPQIDALFGLARLMARQRGLYPD